MSWHRTLKAVATGSREGLGELGRNMLRPYKAKGDRLGRRPLQKPEGTVYRAPTDDEAAVTAVQERRPPRR